MIEKLWTTSGAGFQVPFPDRDARTAQVPVPVRWTTPAALTVHGPESREYFAARPDDAVAVTVKSGSPKWWPGMAGNVMVWFPSAMANDRWTSGAARKLALPACEAFSVQVPTPLTVTTPLVVTEQGPLALATWTTRPDEAVAVTVKAGSP